MLRCLSFFATCLLLGASAIAAEPGAWQSLLKEIDPGRDAVAGTWQVTDTGLKVNAMSGGRLALPVTAPAEYDLKVTFTRQTGVHSVGLVVVHGGQQVAFEVDAWGQHLAGFQNIGGQTIQNNASRKTNMSLENGRRYTLTVEVRKDQLRGLLDDREISLVKTTGGDLSLSNLWTMRSPQQLGLLAWESDTTFHTIEIRTPSGAPIALAANTPPATRPMPTTPRPQPTPSPAPTANGNARGKRVLIVIANYHFFYREYGEPREELERAGMRVTVAAGRRGLCRPHDGSGQGPDGGNITAEVALADVKADDYDAILFSGGWGASAYQYAFTGRYQDQTYNGDRAVKAEVNRVINQFLEQDKYVCALCNGVSVLAWARVEGKSPLDGKRVCAPVREAPRGIYNGQPGQPSCRWHPEMNGAILSPPGAIGRPGTEVDDVLVDGRIITGENDPSAREMGRRIVQVLSN